MTNTRIGGCFLLLFFFFDSRYCSKRIAFVAFSASSAHVLHDWLYLQWGGMHHLLFLFSSDMTSTSVVYQASKQGRHCAWFFPFGERGPLDSIDLTCASYSSPSNHSPKASSDIFSKKDRGIESIMTMEWTKIKVIKSKTRDKTPSVFSNQST